MTRLLLLLALTTGCAHRLPPAYAPGTEWRGFLLHRDDQWFLGEALAGPAWDRVLWTGDAPDVDPAGAGWYRAELVIEACRMRASEGWPRQRFWRGVALRAPFLFRRRYRGATWEARLVSARPARWPANWRDPPVPLEAGPVPFAGPLHVGSEYAVTLEGTAARWAVQGMEEPGLTGGRSLVWSNPEALPAAALGNVVQATFRVESVKRHLFAVGVLYRHVEGGSYFWADQYTATLTSVTEVPVR